MERSSSIECVLGPAKFAVELIFCSTKRWLKRTDKAWLIAWFYKRSKCQTKRSKFSALKLSVQLRDDQLSYFSPTIQFVCWSTSSSLFYSRSSSSFQRIRWIEFSSHRDKHPNRHKLPTPLGAYFLSAPQLEAQPSLSPGSKDYQFSITRNRAGAGNLSVSIPFSLSDQKTNQSLKHVLPFRFPRQLFSLPQPTEKCSRVTKWQKQTISGPCHRNRVPSAAVAGVVLFRFGSLPRVAFKKRPSGGGPGLCPCPDLLLQVASHFHSTQISQIEAWKAKGK